MKILAIDPGCDESAYVLMDEGYRPLDFGKISNENLLNIVYQIGYSTVVIEMIASYGMAVGKEVFETCVWIGRFHERAMADVTSRRVDYIYRKDVKLNLCGQTRAKDSNIIQALKDRFGNKGTKANPGFFYGFKADCWQAFALGCTYLDLRNEENKK